MSKTYSFSPLHPYAKTGHPKDDTSPIFLGMDFGFGDMTATVAFQRMSDGTMKMVSQHINESGPPTIEGEAVEIMAELSPPETNDGA